MSCYHPLVGIWNGEYTDNGKKKFKIQGNLDPILTKELYPGSVTIPCGHCVGCRLDYSRAWADRMMLELEECKSAVFVTLTYDDKHLVDCAGYTFPCDSSGHLINPLERGSLYKRHFQLFMKKLRKELAKRGILIRFFAVGEYGSWENSHRPHYHAILFGIGLNDLESKIPVGFNELRQEVYTCPLIANCWDHGFISVGDVSWSTCAYVARYVTKKALDPDSDLLNEMFGLNPLFSLMSRKPGIGKPYLDAHPDCLDFQSIYIGTKDGAKKITIPKYFVKKLESTDPEKYASIIAERSMAANDRILSKLNQTDLSYFDYLKVEEDVMLEKIKSLKRYL